MLHDDNFGDWDPADFDDREDMMEFYDHMQSQCVEKVCQGCGRTVRIKYDYAYCDSCMREMGHP